MKKVIYYPFLALLSGALLFSSCKKEIDEVTPVNPYGGHTTISATVSGVVIDQNNKPVAGAKITMGGRLETSDEHGIFSFDNALVNKDRYYMEVSKSGFIKGSRAGIASENNVNYVRVMLMDKNPYLKVNAPTGGSVSLPNGATVDFPTDAFQYENGSSFSGSAVITLAFLDPTSDDFADQMPGDLTALRTDGSEVTLESYGMMAVELNDPSGEKLVLKEGKEATLTFPLASEMRSTAPAEIPLWYFDEARGVWQEEGIASISGSSYVASAKHFTFWNCDRPWPRAYVKGRVVDCNGKPLAGVRVRMVSDSWRSVVTDNDGYYESDASATITFQLQVFGKDYFGYGSDPINVGPLSEGEVGILENIVVDCPSALTGTITDCDGNPVKGTVYVSWGNSWSYIQTEDGYFNLVVKSDESVTIFVYSGTGESNGGVLVTTPVGGVTKDIGDLKTCIAPSQGNSFIIDGGTYNNEFILITPGPNNGTGIYYKSSDHTSIYIYDVNQTSGINFWFLGNDVGSFNSQDPSTYFDLWVSGVSADSGAANIDFDVTKYEDVGGKIEGTFSGTFQDWQGTTTYTVTNGMFSAIRRPDQ